LPVFPNATSSATSTFSEVVVLQKQIETFDGCIQYTFQQYAKEAVMFSDLFQLLLFV